MASHTSPDAASSRSRRLRRALIVAMLCAAPLAASMLHAMSSDVPAARVYVWRDAGGAVRFSPVR
ncbi:MAG: hypothetical protein SF182_03855 [Deltaproteobacteria bacterium]|nr:hypothetical protein [Deltaproteobacteria bacterium]